MAGTINEPLFTTWFNKGRTRRWSPCRVSRTTQLPVTIHRIKLTRRHFTVTPSGGAYPPSYYAYKYVLGEAWRTKQLAPSTSTIIRCVLHIFVQFSSSLFFLLLLPLRACFQALYLFFFLSFHHISINHNVWYTCCAWLL